MYKYVNILLLIYIHLRNENKSVYEFQSAETNNWYSFISLIILSVIHCTDKNY